MLTILSLSLIAVIWIVLLVSLYSLAIAAGSRKKGNSDAVRE